MLLLGFFAGLYWVMRGETPAPVYLSEKVERGSIEDAVLASGVLQPIRKVEVGAQVSGQLKTLKVALGERVRVGQLLAEIDPALALTDLRIQRAELDALRAQQRGASAKLARAEREFARQERLRRDEVSSDKEWQSAVEARDSALADEAMFKARIAQARYKIERQRTELTYTRISAPIDGEVLKIDTKQGQTVISAQQAPKILTLGDLSRMEVWAQVSEADIVRIRPGLRAYFSLLGSPEKRHYGIVREIQPSPEKINNAMFYNVLFDVENPDRSLRIEMTAQVAVVLSQVSNSLQVPLSALGKQADDGRYPVRVLPGTGPGTGIAQQRMITVGVMSRTHAQVLSGLQEGERIITSPPDESGAGISISMG